MARVSFHQKFIDSYNVVTIMCLQVYELAQEIAECLTDDRHTLYNLCLVNRACLSRVARVLWKSPFTISKSSSKCQFKVIRESLMFANNEEKQDANLILEQWNTSALFQSQLPTLPYLSFIRTLDVEGLHTLMYNWLNMLNLQNNYRKNIRETITMRNGFDLSLILCKLVVRHSSRIDDVNLTLKRLYAGTNSEMNLFTLPNASVAFKHLKKITCHDYVIGDMEATALASILKLNTSLVNLNLRNNQLTETGITVLARSINFLTHLDLGNNKVGDMGAISLSAMLESNFTLHFLYLTSNVIGDKGATALSKALEVNSTLVCLELGNNEIGNIGAVALAETLTTNTSLTFLGLSYNNIGDEGMEALANALKVNSKVCCLNSVRGDNFTARHFPYSRG